MGVSAAGVAGAALLAACGSDDNEGTSQGALQPPRDTSREAKQDGPLVSAVTADAQSFEPGLLSPGANAVLPYAVSTLLTIKPGHLEPSGGDIVGDLAEALPEVSPDGLQLTFKLRPDLSWHPVDPVNGRSLVADDILYSWQRFVDRGNFRALLANSVDPNAPVTTVAMPDSRTIQMKLAAPLAGTVEALLAFRSSGYFLVLPKEEGEGKVDLKSTVIGTGPYLLKEYSPSSRFVYERFDKYWDSKNVFLTRVERPILSEYASRLAQFKTGTVLQGAQPTTEDLLLTLKELPALELYDTGVPDQLSIMVFGWTFTGDQPLRDERVRQALSMSIDRDGFLEFASSAPQLEGAGIPVEQRWHTALSAGFYEGWWLDPKSKEFGPNARFYEHNLPEAKKLLAAAGYGNGVQLRSNFVAGGLFGATYERDIDLLEGMSGEAGFQWEKVPMTQNEFATRIQFSQPRRNFQGLAHTPSPFTQPDAVERIYSQFHPKGPYFAAFDSQGRGDASGDPELTAQIERARLEQDTGRRKEMVKELQRSIAKTQYDGRYPGVSSVFLLNWPALKNVQVYQNDSRPNMNVWLDKNAEPFKRA